MHDDLDPDPPPMPAVRWDIGRQGRAWAGEEARDWWELTPEEFEMDRGKLFSVLIRKTAPVAGERAHPRRTRVR